MLEYVIRRIMLGGVTAILLSVVIFFILRIAPGDVIDAILAEEGAGVYNAEYVAELRQQLGIDRPLPVQYFTWMRDFVTLNWGDSLIDGSSIWFEFKNRLPVTLELSLMAVTIAIILGLPAGMIMALKQDTPIDYVVRVVSLLGLSVPNFWTGTLMIVIGVMYFNWSPALEYVSFLENPRENFLMFIWPALATGWVSQATKARMMRSTMLEVLRQDYIRTAHAKGLRNFVVVYRHAMKNALLPVITVIGISIALTVGGSVIMETVFQLSGLGFYLVFAMQRFDYPVVQTMIMVFGLWIVAANLIVDLAYGWLDPRIRY